MGFLSAADEALGAEFLERGYVVVTAESSVALDDLRMKIVNESRAWLETMPGVAPMTDLSRSHDVVDAARVNELRLHLFAALNADPRSRARYFALGRHALESIVGNELAMQTKINLSIQQPADAGSVLDIHSDVWTGDSPFQVVLWVPLTDTTGTNAMFFLAPRHSADALRRVRDGELASMAAVRDTYADRISTIEMKAGQVLIFNSNCLHGNQVNTTTMSRWSLNCRFVSLLAPATNPERRLGSYYVPITTRAATRMGLQALAAMESES